MSALFAASFIILDSVAFIALFVIVPILSLALSEVTILNPSLLSIFFLTISWVPAGCILSSLIPILTLRASPLPLSDGSVVFPK